MHCPTALSAPHLSFAHPEHLEFLFLQVGLLCVLDSLVFAYVSKWSRGSRIRGLPFIVGNLLPLIGYYVMYGLAQPWETAIQAWNADMLKSFLQADCNLLFLQRVSIPALDASHHLFLLGILLVPAGYVCLSFALMPRVESPGQRRWRLRRSMQGQAE